MLDSPQFSNYLSPAQGAGLSRPLPADLDEEALEKRLFPGSGGRQSGPIPLPDFARIREELSRHRHVTLQLLWQEYKQTHRLGSQER